MKKAYIAGKMRDNPNYQKQFIRAEDKLKKLGWLVMNPSYLPDGFEAEQYYKINMAMIDACDTVFFLPNWTESRGAHLEMGYAIGTYKNIRIWKDVDYD